MYDCKLSVIIVPHDRPCPPEPCLYSLRAAVDGLDAEIFFASGPRTDARRRADTAAAAVAYPDRLPDESDVQFVNRIITTRCRGEYILLLHPDTVIGEDSLRTLCCFMDEHAAEAGAAGVKMLDGNGLFLPESMRGWPSPQALRGRLCHTKQRLACDLSGLDPDRPHRVDIVSDAFLLLNHDALKKTGLPDETLPKESAVHDLLYRMSAAGYALFYYPERILHCGGEASRRGSGKHIRAFYDALLLFYRTHYPTARTTIFLIRLRRRHALLFEKKRKPHRLKTRRLMAFCRESSLEEITRIARQEIPETSHVVLRDPARRRLTEVIADRRTKMQACTDIVCCHPDISFAQILLLMERMAEKTTAFHLYLARTQQFISCETA
ncbi:MAG: glycosyltransferase family 2 protein [Tannerella sp.]|nr:glycosyltransferase family 2 protein [Tannerella sp.]